MAAESNLTIIVGGGFVGLFSALHLRHQSYPDPIVLIDAQARFVFKPLLYEYLTGEMHSDQVLPRYDNLLSDGITFVQDTVTQIDLTGRSVTTASGKQYDYRYLVLAVGSVQGFGSDGAEAHAFPFRTQQDIETLEHHLRDCLQQACQTSDSSERQKLLTVAVVGAGPSGIEAAATLADLLPKWYSGMGGKAQEIRIVLINHGDEILKGDINAHLQETVRAALKERITSVELLLGVSVQSVSSDQLTYQAKDAEPQTLPTATTIWTAGTATNPLLKHLALSDQQRDRHGLPVVSPTLQLPDFPEVFAAGDCAVVQSKPLPPVAQVAYQQGAGIAHNLLRLSQGESPQPVEVKLRGTLMKLGIRNGVANLFDRVQVNSRTGDLIRSATYLEMLPTPLHNLKTTVEWIEEDIFHRYHPPSARSSDANLTRSKASSSHPTTEARPHKPQPIALLWMLGGAAIAAALITGISIAERSIQWPQPPAPAQRSNSSLRP